jgi:putative restriction endonuclease
LVIATCLLAGQIFLLMKVVFTHKRGSIYDDLPEERYHFPRSYIRQVEAAVGDFVVYYEPGRTGVSDLARTGRRAYFATARVAHLEPDPARSEHYYALIEPGSYVEFGRPVPFREGAHYYERQLQRDDGATSKGAFGRAVRSLSETEFAEILAAGFARELDPLGASINALDLVPLSPGLAEPAVPFERDYVDRVLSRPVRDAAFARTVQIAYGATCAVTGLKIINGGGRAEVQAAHIRPVAQQGPDSVRNGVALCGTIHWMFDRGLISFGPPPDYRILVTGRGLPEAALRLLNPERRLLKPANQRWWPAPGYCEYHRTSVFKA